VDRRLLVVLDHERDRVRDREEQQQQLQVEQDLPRLLARLLPTADPHAGTLRRCVLGGEPLERPGNEPWLAWRHEDAPAVVPERRTRPLRMEGAQPLPAEIAIIAAYVSPLDHRVSRSA
jgi:hypothetical protein